MLYLAARHLAQAKSRWLGRTMEGKVSSMMEQHLKLLRTPAKPAMDGSTSSALQHFNAEGRLRDCKADHWRVARLMGKTERISKPRPPKPPTTKAEKAPPKHLRTTQSGRNRGQRGGGKADWKVFQQWPSEDAAK